MKNDLERLKNKNLPCANCKALKAIEVIKECFDFNGFDELIPNDNWWRNEDKQIILGEFIKMLREKTFDEFLMKKRKIKRYRYKCGIDLNATFNEAFNEAIKKAFEEIKKRNLKQ